MSRSHVGHDGHPHARPGDVRPLHLAIALEGAGWHPAAWRGLPGGPQALFTTSHWAEVAALAERGRLDFLTIEDSLTLQAEDAFAPQPDETTPERTDRVRGRLDALLVAAALAPRTRHVGLVPTVTTTSTEPFHVSKAVATLDHVSHGRGGWRVQVGGTAGEIRHVGRRDAAPLDPALLDTPDGQRVLRERFDEAADHVEVVRRLWDSWEDGAEIRDTATGRFVDRERLHYVDFDGAHFSVRGPSITPRPPQGQPVVVALAHQTVPYELAARSSDVVLVTPHDDEDAVRILDEVRAAERRVGREGEPLRVLADLVVVLDETVHAARARRRRLDEEAGAPLTSDALVVTDTASGLADLALRWHRLGYDGVRLRPAVTREDLRRVVDGLVPRLQTAGVLRREYGDETLRERLRLPTAVNRYAAPSSRPGPLTAGAGQDRRPA